MLDSQALQLADNLSLNRSFPATLPIILKKSNTENKSSESPAILFSPELGFEEIDKRNKNALSKINADLYVQRGVQKDYRHHLLIWRSASVISWQIHESSTKTPQPGPQMYRSLKFEILIQILL